MKRGYLIFKVGPGWMGLVGHEKGIERIFLPSLTKKELKSAILAEFPGPLEEGAFAKAEREIKEYFAGRRMQFEFPLDLAGATPFQRRVYRGMAKIPFGEVRTYRWLAEMIGQPKAVRAVGGASGRNRWPLAIPCHRIIGSDCRLTGFSAPGGLNLKSRLLRLEGVFAEKDRVFFQKGDLPRRGRQ